MKRAFSVFLSLGFVSVFALGAHAEERYKLYRGIRTLGMGGASVAVVNDETALLVNPAALGKLRDYYLTVFDPELEVGSKSYATAGNDLMHLDDPQKALNKANLHPDANMHDRYQVFPSLVVPNFGFGVFGKYETDARLNSTTGKFDYNYVNDYAAVFGVDFRLFNGILKIGANARAINHSVAQNDSIDPTSTNLTLSSMLSEGMGIGSDAGMILTAPVAMLPTLAAVYRDIGRTSYTFRGGMMHSTTNAPDSTPSTLDGALSISPIMGKRMRSVWTVQYDDAMNAYKENDTMRRVHGGVEFNYADALFVRGGWNQRYWTAGVELAIVNYQFQAASYGEDIGVVGTPKEDRRYVVKFAFRF